MISGGSVGILFQSWIALALFVLAVVVTFAPMLLKRMRV
jgi:TctA family transporter